MKLVTMFDAAFPPKSPYPNAQAVGGYIGGDTPHVWTPDEWRRFSHLYQLPIWVSTGNVDPIGQAKAAAAKAKALGWLANNGNDWRAIVLDRETTSDEAFNQAFGEQLQDEGFLCWMYMSGVALPSDPPGYSIWLPTFNHIAQVPSIHNVIAAQYAPDVNFPGGTVDLSVVEESVLNHFGQGPRHG